MKVQNRRRILTIFVIFVGLFLIGSLVFHQSTVVPTTQAQSPVKVIFETDMTFDVDDAGAMAVLHALADNGEAEILGISYNEVQDAAPALDAMNTWYNRGYLPIGLYPGTLPGDGDDDRYWHYLDDVGAMSHNLSDNTVTNSVDMYKTLLAAEPDNSVTVISVGFLNNLYDLLQDSEGYNLVDAKVKELVIMGGIYNDGFNLVRHNTSSQAKYVIQNWPGNIVMTYYGAPIETGDTLSSEPANNPIRESYRAWNSADGNPEFKPRSSWDQLAVYYGIRGLDGKFYRRTSGNLVLEGQTIATFNSTTLTYIEPSISDSAWEDVLNPLMTQAPISVTPTPTHTPDGPTPTPTHTPAVDPEVTGTIIGTEGYTPGYGGGPREDAVDGDTATFFDAPSADGAWVGYDFGSGNEKVITRLRYYPRSSFASRMVGGKFQGANNADFSDAVNLYTITSTPPYAYTEVNISNGTAFRYVRYMAPNGGWGNIAELDFYGHDGSGPTPTNTPVLPTNTPVPPTNTPVPPTNTPVPPTNTPVPPTNTPVPPTATPDPGVNLTGVGSIIAAVTSPTGSGNDNIEIIRDGVMPPVGNDDSSTQYDTYNGSGGPVEEYVGYIFTDTYNFTQVVFQEGKHFWDGGWFADGSLVIQVRQNNSWNVVSASVSPAYPNGNTQATFGSSYETYTFSLNATGDGIRIYGTAGGSAPFISVGELKVYGDGSVPPTNTPVPPTNTPVPPTNTPVPPTNTPVSPTNTPVSPTNTPVPPTATPDGPDPEVTGTIIGTDGAWCCGYTKELAVDGNTGTYFDAPNENSDYAWVGYDFGAGNEKVITRLRYYPRSSFASRMVGGKFQGANNADFSDAVDLHTISNTPPYAYTSVNISNGTAFRYVRYLAPAASWGNIAELDFYGHASGPAPTNTPVPPTNTPAPPTNTPVPPTPTNTPVPGSDLQLHYDFSNGSGTTVSDLSGNGNNGTLTNFSNTSAGAGSFNSSEGWVSGGGLSFLDDGTRSYVETNLALNSLDNSDFTIEYTANYAGASGWTPLIGSNAGSCCEAALYLGIDSGLSNNHVRVVGYTANIGSQPWGSSSSTQHHLAWVFDNSADQIELFVDGSSAGTFSMNANMNHTSEFRLGNTGWNSGEQWDGVIFGVAITKAKLAPGTFVLD